MVANMISVRKTILVALIGNRYMIMVSPKITGKSKQTYEINEGYLSLDGQRKAARYKLITVVHLEENFEKKRVTLKNFEVQIVQYELTILAE